VSGRNAELVLGGILTGAVIGFFWHPLAAFLAMFTVALIALGADRLTEDSRASSEAAWRSRAQEVGRA
jgi:hypothetical protein